MSSTSASSQVLIAKSRARFEANGGKVLENSPLASVAIRPGAAVLTTRDGTELRTRLVIDCMGQRSPIVAQVRGDAPPDGVCVVVGSCADGYAEEMNTFGDVIFADTTTQPSGASDCPTPILLGGLPRIRLQHPAYDLSLHIHGSGSEAPVCIRHYGGLLEDAACVSGRIPR